MLANPAVMVYKKHRTAKPGKQGAASASKALGVYATRAKTQRESAILARSRRIR